MDEIKKLVRIITTRVKKNVSLIDVISHDENPSKEQQLFNGIQKGLYNTDDEASLGMYESDSTDQRFRMLKSRLRYKLYNLLYFVDFNDSKVNIGFPYEQECHSYIFRAKILFKEGEYELAEKHINKALAISKEAEFTELTLSGLRILRTIYAEMCRPNHLRKTIGRIKKYEEIMKIEEESDNIFNTRSMQLRKSVHSRRVHLDSTMKSVSSLKSLWEKSKSFDAFENFYRLSIASNESLGEYETILKLTSETEDLVKAGKVNPLRFDIRYNVYIKTYAYLRAKDFKNGMVYAKAGLEHIGRSSRNWFAHMVNYFLMALHSGNYELAEDLIGQVYRNPHMEKISQRAKERWELYKAYLFFLMPNRDVEDVLDFSKIYQKLPFYTQDKQGLMVAIMILEFIDLMKKDKLDIALTRLPNTEKYIYRYLNENPESQREKLFLKLITIMVESSFNPTIAAKKGEKYFNRLKGTPEPGDAFAEIEIVPYEQLWEMMLQNMEHSFVRLDFGR
jgi:tetratricopeptide (TPR) repeat protein